MSEMSETVTRREEFVQDYPLPPVVQDNGQHIRVVFNGVTIAETHRAKRVLEKGHPPVYYIPPEDVNFDHLTHSEHRTLCEFKGWASYYSVIVDRKVSENAAWFYPQPAQHYTAIKNYIAFYPGKVDGCYVDDDKVQPEEDQYYGGWITSTIRGPYKRR